LKARELNMEALSKRVNLKQDPFLHTLHTH